MLNYETLLSNYDDKLTLMQWLKKVEDALKDASAVSFDVVNLGNATFKFKIVFEDGSEIESGQLVINQGDSVASGAIVNGHLILTLTNGDTIDAGNMFDGNVNITGTLDVGNDVSINGDVNITGNTSVGGDLPVTGKITGGEIVENMTGYAFYKSVAHGQYFDLTYVGVSKTGNKLTIVITGKMNVPTTADIYTIGGMNIPAAVGAKLYPITGTQIAFLSVNAQQNYSSRVTISGIINKNSNNNIDFRLYAAGLTANTDYYFRIEQTYLLGENLAA